MAEYIDKAKVLEKAVAIKGYSSKMISAWDVAHIPSADVAEVKHGKWMKEDKGFGRNITTLHLMRVYKYICPLCGYYTDNQASRFNFCPNCGATMDGEEK